MAKKIHKESLALHNKQESCIWNRVAWACEGEILNSFLIILISYAFLDLSNWVNLVHVLTFLYFRFLQHTAPEIPTTRRRWASSEAFQRVGTEQSFGGFFNIVIAVMRSLSFIFHRSSIKHRQYLPMSESVIDCNHN